MKIMSNNKKGFTLIELLAVIVVLAIVLVLATSTVLPMLNRARHNAFAIEVNSAIDAASQAVSLIQIGSYDGTTAASADYKRDVNSSTGTITYCFSLKKLLDMQLLKKDATLIAAGATYSAQANKYQGTVTVTVPKSTTGNYTYHAEMTDGKLFVIKDGNAVEADVKEISELPSSTMKSKCN